jgi:hypothetical protein
LEHAVIRSRWAGAPGRLVLARRLVLPAAAAAALITALAGCEAGTNAPTLQFHPPTDSATENAGTIAIRNLFVLGAPLGRDLAAGSSASVFLALINTGAPGTQDTLVSISARGTATSVTLPAGGIPVKAGHPIYYAGPFPQIVLTDLLRPLASGTAIRLVLSFAREGSVSIDVPVMPRAGQYATLAPPSVTTLAPPQVTASPAATAPTTHPGTAVKPIPAAKASP